MRSAALKRASRRIAFLKFALLGLFFILAGRAAHLTVLGGGGPRDVDDQLQTRMKLPPTRGLITDRNGVELAITIHAASIYVMPQELKQDQQALGALARALGMPVSDLAKRLANRKNFTFVARWVDDEVARRVVSLELRGVGIVREPRRAYPAGGLAGSILGFANIDGSGVRGIEQREDAWLRGSEVRVPVERDARGRLLSHHIVPPREAMGGDVALTIDASMQAEAEAALRDAVEKCGARGGSVITLDPRTGEILALAEAPGFDPNEFRKSDYRASRSPAFADAVEPGSTFKAFLMAAALDAGVVERDEIIDTGDGTIRVPGKLIRDHHPYGPLDPAGILQVSSNVGTVTVAQRLGASKYYGALQRFGFGKKTGSGFPQESSGLLRPYQQWQPVDHATIAFGQGVSVTAIQLASAMAVLAGDGEWKRPRLIAARRRSTGDWERTHVEDRRPVVRKQTARTVLRMLESVVSAEGTGRRAALAGVRVAGKTGTAQKYDAEQKRYSQKDYIAWFMGAAPADDPRLVVVAMLDEPQGRAHGGGDVAAPLFARVAAGQLAELGIATRPQPIRAAPRRPVLVADGEAPVEDPKQSAPPASAPKREQLARVESKSESAPAKARPVSDGTGAGGRAHDAKDARTQGAEVAKRKPQPTPPPVSANAPSAPKVVRVKRSTSQSKPEIAKHAEPEQRKAVLMPDFRGETVAAAQRLAEREDLDLEIRGRGLAVRQDPSPGTVVVGARRQVRVFFSGTNEEG